MEDREIVDLYWRRDEAAISATEEKYGAYCRSIARNILTVWEDAEECVSDTWHRAWRAMPPQRPAKLKAWLGRVTRNGAINLWNRNHRQKRYGGMEQLLEELEECLPAARSPEETVLEERELSRFLDEWLASLPREDRTLFLRRYWKGEPLSDLEKAWGLSHGQMAKRMYRLRAKLKDALEREGYTL